MQKCTCNLPKKVGICTYMLMALYHGIEWGPEKARAKGDFCVLYNRIRNAHVQARKCIYCKKFFLAILSW